MSSGQLLFFLCSVAITVTSCGNKAPGKTLQYQNSTLYYTANVSKGEAEQLGNFLNDEGFFSMEENEVLIDKENDTYYFKVVVDGEAIDDPNFINLAEAFGRRLSEMVFNNAPVDFYICKDDFKVRHVVEFTPAESIIEQQSDEPL